MLTRHQPQKGLYSQSHELKSNFNVQHCSFHSTCAVTHGSICVCSDIEIWTSGPLPEVKYNRKIQVTSTESVVVASKVLDYSDRTGRNLVL